jgi:hypothetical protein
MMHGAMTRRGTEGGRAGRRGKDEGQTLTPESDSGKKVVSRRFRMGTAWEKEKKCGREG